MNQREKAARLAALHVKGAPLQLFNVRMRVAQNPFLTPALKRPRHFRRTES
jgi:hypothetical protein